MLQRVFKSKATRLLTLGILCITAFAFSTKPGGEGFEIYINNKLVLQRFGDQMNKVQNLQVTQWSADDNLTIKYHHCGRVGKNRIITVKDGQNKILKEWKFADLSTTPMDCKMKEIVGLQKVNAGTLNIYYSSTELPKGRQLASLTFASANAKVAVK